jgi:hypothetical protein
MCEPQAAEAAGLETELTPESIGQAHDEGQADLGQVGDAAGRYPSIPLRLQWGYYSRYTKCERPGKFQRLAGGQSQAA